MNDSPGRWNASILTIFAIFGISKYWLSIWNFLDIDESIFSITNFRECDNQLDLFTIWRIHLYWNSRWIFDLWFSMDPFFISYHLQNSISFSFLRIFLSISFPVGWIFFPMPFYKNFAYSYRQNHFLLSVSANEPYNYNISFSAFFFHAEFLIFMSWAFRE